MQSHNMSFPLKNQSTSESSTNMYKVILFCCFYDALKEGGRKGQKIGREKGSQKK